MDELVFEPEARGDSSVPRCLSAPRVPMHRMCVPRAQGTGLRSGEPHQTLVAWEEIGNQNDKRYGGSGAAVRVKGNVHAGRWPRGSSYKLTFISWHLERALRICK